MKKKKSWFLKVAGTLSEFAGRAATFVGAVSLVVLWAALGPIFGFSDTWQLVINTSTTIITFLMVFLIQNTQNRDTAAIQTKLDELIRATAGAHNALRWSVGSPAGTGRARSGRAGCAGPYRALAAGVAK